MQFNERKRGKKTASQIQVQYMIPWNQAVSNLIKTDRKVITARRAQERKHRFTVGWTNFSNVESAFCRLPITAPFRHIPTVFCKPTTPRCRSGYGNRYIYTCRDDVRWRGKHHRQSTKCGKTVFFLFFSLFFRGKLVWRIKFSRMRRLTRIYFYYYFFLLLLMLLFVFALVLRGMKKLRSWMWKYVLAKSFFGGAVAFDWILRGTVI